MKSKGSKTVEPIRKRSHIEKVKKNLKQKKSLRDLTLFILGISSGLRGSDLLKMVWESLVTDDGKIRNRICVEEKKTGKTNKMDLSKNTIKAIKEYWEEQGKPTEGLVFKGRKGNEPMTIQHLHLMVNQWMQDSGVSGHFGSHTLRKTFGFFFLQAGGSLLLLCEKFSHSSGAITRRYCGITEQDIAEITKSMNF